MELTRQIHLSDGVTDFLQYILDRDASSTSLIVCSTRDSFLKKIKASCDQWQDSAGNSQLFTKSIGLLSKSSRIKVVFCPTLEHLRAYLSSFRLVDRAAQDATADRQRTSRHLMAILDPLALHVPTLEFSAQGLSRTFATAVEVASREAIDLVLCESRDLSNPAENGSGEALWHAEVPLFNGSTRRTGQPVPVKRIVLRWFIFDEDQSLFEETVDI
ncbi:hypothetical protein BDV59DRAFT_118510 [Aspergillus ambiguus]|uniref:uncharacterized protein n=1 Tax=Aspergillus ambiguus TaxID=176160 RepID=UPI003CCE0CD0